MIYVNDSHGRLGQPTSQGWIRPHQRDDQGVPELLEAVAPRSGRRISAQAAVLGVRSDGAEQRARATRDRAGAACGRCHRDVHRADSDRRTRAGARSRSSPLPAPRWIPTTRRSPSSTPNGSWARVSSGRSMCCSCREPESLFRSGLRRRLPRPVLHGRGIRRHGDRCPNGRGGDRLRSRGRRALGRRHRYRRPGTRGRRRRCRRRCRGARNARGGRGRLRGDVRALCGLARPRGRLPGRSLVERRSGRVLAGDRGSRGLADRPSRRLRRLPGLLFRRRDRGVRGRHCDLLPPAPPGGVERGDCGEGVVVAFSGGAVTVASDVTEALPTS